MGFSVSSKIKLNMPVVKQLDRAKQQALEQTGDALLKQVKNTQVMPFDTGNLRTKIPLKIVRRVGTARLKSCQALRMQGGCIFIPSIISAVRKTLPLMVNGSHRGLRAVHGRIFAVGHL